MGEPTLYRPVKIGKGALSEQVARQIIDLIATRQLEVGSRLPPLDVLAGYLEVSRTAVREAVKLLDAWGAVMVKHGVGTFVAGLTEDALTIPFLVSAERSGKTIRNLHQVREALEPDIAAWAAKNAGPGHIEELKEAIRKMDQALHDREGYIPADVTFHTTLAKATGNDLFLIVIRPVIDLFHDAMRLSEQTPGARERGQEFHRRLLEHIAAGNADKARKVMHAHLDQVWHDIETQLDEGK